MRTRARRARSARALATDEKILEAAGEVIRTRGWGGTSAYAVANQAGVTSRAITDRHPTLSDLGVAVWRNGPGQDLARALTGLLQAALPLPDSGERPDEAAATRELVDLGRPDDRHRIAIELLCATPFDDVLRSALAADVQAWTDPWLRSGTAEEQARAAQVVFLLVAAFGLLLAHHRPGADDVDLRPVIIPILDALRSPASPSALPDVEATQMRLDPVGPPIVDDHDALLAATILNVADHGYEEATLDRIVASIGATQGMVFSRHRTKADLFVAAVQWRTEYALKANAEWYGKLAADIGSGLAEAVMWREYLRPEHKRGRCLALEQLRVGWHEPAVQSQNDAAEAAFSEGTLAETDTLRREAAASDLHLSLALGYGAELLPELLPDAWTLPFDVVTVPMSADRS